MLHLLPNLLADLPSHENDLPSSVDRVVATLTHLIAENEKEGRRFLRRFSFPPPKTFREIPILLLNEHTSSSEKRELIAAIKRGGVFGLISDCGLPCLADPGADLVLMAREAGIEVTALPGPSSPLLALILSGLGGQHFTFHGYLPKEKGALEREIKRIETLSLQDRATHLFIERPYANEQLFLLLLSSLREGTLLCVACDLTTPLQWVETHSTGVWRGRGVPSIDKHPCIFVLRA